MKKLNGQLVGYRLTDSPDEQPVMVSPNEVFIGEEDDPFPGAICVKWKEDGIDPTSPDEVSIWILNPATLHFKEEATFDYELEPEHPEVDS